MKEKIYIIYSFYSHDIDIKGYIRGSAEDANNYCKSKNEKCDREFDKIYYEELTELKKETE